MAFDDLAPKVGIVINDTEWGESALDYVSAVQVDLALDKADLITLRVENPVLDVPGQKRTSDLVFTNSLAFMPGNIIEVYFGYGGKADTFCAAGIIKKWMPHFPRKGVPSITVKALDGSCLMMDGAGVINCMAARRFDTGTTISDMATIAVGDYGFGVADMEFTDQEPAVVTIKKAGMNDYAFVRGLANLVGFEFFVDWSPDAKQWVAHWRAPLVDDANKRTFTWGPDFADIGEGGILLDFTPEFATQGAATDIEVYYFDRDSKTWEKVIYPEKEPDHGSEKASFRWSGDAATVEADLAEVSDASTGRGLMIKASGIAVEVVPNANFNSAEEAFKWAEAWWDARQSLLLQGRGSIIGYPELRPGQVHTFQGIGAGLNGDWYIHECQHIFKKGAAYECKFVARKVVP